jgi:hypothetical protein
MKPAGWRRALILACTALYAPSASAATFYDFMWSDGGSLSATGFLALDDAVGVGDPFDTSDVLEFDLELFEGGISQGTGEFPPFDPDFHALEGTRGVSGLSIVDLYVSVPFGIRFGCEAGDCLSGRVFFEATVVDFGSTAAARASFVFTEVPEPGVEGSIAAALAALAVMRMAGRASLR